MSKQLLVPPKRGRGRPPKVREPEPEPESESETEQYHNLEDRDKDKNKDNAKESTFIHPHTRFALPNRQHNPNDFREQIPEQIPEPTEDMDIILQQIHDSEIAMALDASFATYTANSEINMNNGASIDDSDDMTEILRQIREQEESDAELARQLAAEDNPQPQGADQENDIDDVLEQIRQMEAQEQLKKKGNAFAKPLSLDRLLAKQDDEDEEIRKQVQSQMYNDTWRAERKRQDLAFQESLKLDQEKEKERIKRRLPQPPQPPQQPQPPIQDEDKDEVEDAKPIPQTNEEMRAARLKFFNNN
jgi:hypothetical protein